MLSAHVHQCPPMSAKVRQSLFQTCPVQFFLDSMRQADIDGRDPPPPPPGCGLSKVVVNETNLLVITILLYQTKILKPQITFIDYTGLWKVGL